MTQIIGSSLIVDDRPGRAWGWFVGVGVVLAMLGALASANLMFATLAATITVGVMMFAGGVFQLVHAFGVRRRGGHGGGRCRACSTWARRSSRWPTRCSRPAC
jgi:uncharacterized membrane protein HdeD (DUF308 family)